MRWLILVSILSISPARAEVLVPTGDPALDAITASSEAGQQRMNAAIDDSVRQTDQAGVQQQLRDQSAEIDRVRQQTQDMQRKLERCRAVGC
jgi:hypothetical protein